MTDFPHRIFATPTQERLLKAALMQGDEAIAAWEQWRSEVNWEAEIDQGCFRLLPLLYTNLKYQGVDHPLMGKLKGIYRQAWSKNQTLFHEMGRIINCLQVMGIQTMLLKGAPLSLLYYKNNGARPMADIDVLVRRNQVLQAYRFLVNAGWSSPIPLTDMDLDFGHAIQLDNKSGLEFDLHWRPFNGCSDVCESDFWDDALEVVMANVPSLAPNPTIMLFHVVIHGVPWNPIPPIRWIADAVILTKGSDKAIDWHRLINLAEKHHVGLRLKVGLKYLYDEFRFPIPEQVMQKVKRLPVSYLEYMEDRFMMTEREKKISSPYAAFCCHLFRYRRLTTGEGKFPLLGFPRYLQWRLDAGSNYELLAKGVSVMGKMLLARPFAVRPR